MTVYLISGLGADYRVFQHLKFPDPVSVRHVVWIEPGKDETFASYCSRLSVQINASEEFALIGVSFGGIIATELAKSLNPQATIIISSVSRRQELPRYFKVIGKAGLHKLVPGWMYKRPNFYLFWLFGLVQKQEKQLLRQILKDSSAHFLKWAIDKILNWTNTERCINLLHIHGTKDRVFPVKKTQADIRIIDGGHFMVYNKADQIQPLLNSKLGCSKL